MTAEPSPVPGRTGSGGPSSRHFRILVNPVAGGGSAPAAVARVEALLSAAGARVVVERSASAEHSRTSATEAIAGGEVVVAAGGDGMLASIAGTVVEQGGTLGIVPSGRGNDFARMLRLDGDPERLAHHLLEGDPTPVDVIETTSAAGGPATVVLGSMYAGVDSLASQIVDRSRWLPPSMQYPYAAVRALLSYRPACFTLTVDGEVHQRSASSVVVANSGYYGNGMHIAPNAEMHDGLLDVVVLPSGSRLGMVRRLPKVYDGSHTDLPEVTVLRGRSVEVSTSHEVAAYGDGERLGPLPRTATVLPGALSVLLA